MMFYKNLFPQFPFFFGGFLNHLPDRRRTRLLCWKWTPLWGMSVFCASDEHFSAGYECVKNTRSNFIPTQLHITSDFQTELLSRMLLTCTCTHRWKQAVAFMLMYLSLSKLHPQVIYTIATSAGLNSLQVDRGNDKRTSPYTPSSL